MPQNNHVTPLIQRDRRRNVALIEGKMRAIYFESGVQNSWEFSKNFPLGVWENVVAWVEGA